MNTKSISRLLFAACAVVFMVACNASEPQATGTITGGVYHDCNNDGECDCDDQGIPDITI